MFFWMKKAAWNRRKTSFQNSPLILDTRLAFLTASKALKRFWLLSEPSGKFSKRNKKHSLEHTFRLLDYQDQLFFWQNFCQIPLGIQIVWKFISEASNGYKRVKNQNNFLRIVSLMPYSIVWTYVCQKKGGLVNILILSML